MCVLVQVSCTVTFDPASEGPQLAHALDQFQFQLKGVSFLPRERRSGLPDQADAPYAQMPYESISADRYDALMLSVDVAQLAAALPRSTTAWDAGPVLNDVPDKFCDTAACSLDSV